MVHRRTVRKNRGRKLNKKQMRQVKSLMTRNQEIKYLDANIAATSIPYTGVFWNSMTQVGQGINDHQRVGDRLTVKKLTIRASMVGQDATNQMRLIVFQWFPNTAVTTPVIGTILENPLYQITSSINRTNEEGRLFKIMFDKTYTLVQNASNGSAFKTLKFYGRRIPRKIISYNPTATTGFNQFYFLAISDSVLPSDPSVAWSSRLDFTDA
jgi:hypothetical protein